MKKWEKPELKVLGVENTLEGISSTNIYAGDGYKWVCNACGGDERNTISDIGVEDKTLDIIYTQDQSCAICRNQTWRKVEKDTIPSVGLS